MGLLYGRGERLTALFGGFRPGQFPGGASFPGGGQRLGGAAAQPPAER